MTEENCVGGSAIAATATMTPYLSGYLFKWTNYIKGYQKRWFVLSNSILSYYRHKRDVSRSCRGSICMHKAFILSEDPCNFVISNCDESQTFHLRASNSIELQKWISILKRAKLEASESRHQETDEDDEEEATVDIDALGSSSPLNKHTEIDFLTFMNSLDSKLKDLTACYELLRKIAYTFENVQQPLKTAAISMVNSSQEFVDFCNENIHKWQKVFNCERNCRLNLETIVEQLAQQHSQLEEKVIHEYPGDNNKFSSDDEELFLDALGEPIDFTVAAPPSHRRSSSHESYASEGEIISSADGDNEDNTDPAMDINVIKRQHSLNTILRTDQVTTAVPNLETHNLKVRRSRVPNKPNINFSLWSIMKNCIGKDLSRIPVPVNFSEPLSMLQRLTEDFYYSDILDKAANCSDNCEQMAYVAAFTVSAYSSTAIRTGKPFNPLLGETYECDREDLRFKCITEQVSHHPPMLAQHCESYNGTWRCWQEFSMRSKFKGKYLEVEPLGITHLEFPQSGNHYTWRKVKTVIHNIIIGRLWIDQYGEMEIIEHSNGNKCHIKFEPYSYFGSVAKKVSGTITLASTNHERVEWVLNGTWNDKLEGSPVLAESHGVQRNKPQVEIGSSCLLWQARPCDAGSDKYYNFSRFACQLNEFEIDVAPTDSRRRPDQRYMEEGLWDKANTEKLRLEEKQRRKRGQNSDPVWFKKIKDTQNGDKYIYAYKGGYWEAKAGQDWVGCPDIF